MYQCPYCGKELTTHDVYVDMIVGCRLGDVEHGIDTCDGKEKGGINWDGLLAVTSGNEQDVTFFCGYCDHDLSQEEVEDLILINTKETQ